jgi:hypothetical protein
MRDTPLQKLAKRFQQLTQEGRLFDPPTSNKLSAEARAAALECEADIDEAEIDLMARHYFGGQ